MKTQSRWIRTIVLGACRAGLVLGGADAAHAQCPGVSFEELGIAPTPLVNNQYNSSTPNWYVGSGVRFSAFAPGCPGITCRTAAVVGASSPSFALTTNSGCSNACICIEFNTPQSQVSLDVSTLGLPVASTVHVTAYGTACGTGGVPLGPTINVNIPAPINGTDHTFRTVTVVPDTGDLFQCTIKRIEVCADGIEVFPAIDNLAWGGASPPDVRIDSPLFIQCYCPSDTIIIRGIGCKGVFDCEYSEILEYAPIGAPNVWTKIGAPRTTSLCTANSVLWSFPASILPTNQSIFYLRVTGSNICQKSDSDTTMVKIDRNPPAVAINCPPPGSFISTRCNPLTISASVSDDCQAAWNLSVTPPGGPSSLLTSGNAVTSNTGPAVSSIALPWSPTSADGPYTLSLSALDNCGRSSSTSTTFTLDNTPPLAFIATPTPCQYMCPGFPYAITGKAYDLNMYSWTLEWFNVSVGGYQVIATGSGSVGTPSSNGLLANWTVPANARKCCSMLRLTVQDKTNPRVCGLPNGGNPNCNTSVFYQPVSLGIPCDYNGDGVVSVQDIFDFLGCLFSNPCP